jgi:hypothetical protein
MNLGRSISYQIEDVLIYVANLMWMNSMTSSPDPALPNAYRPSRSIPIHEHGPRDPPD